MTLDHLAITTEDTIFLKTIGRIAFPAFAILCGFFLVTSTSSPKKYLLRILGVGIPTWGIVQILLPNSACDTGSVLLTLGAGIAIYLLAQRKNTKGGTLITILIILSLSQLFLSYGAPGASLVTWSALIFKEGKHLHPIPKYGIGGLLALTSNLPFQNLAETLSQAKPLYLLLYTITILLSATTIPILLKKDPIKKPCPLPNTKFLYIAYLLSFLPSWAITLVK